MGRPSTTTLRTVVRRLPLRAALITWLVLIGGGWLAPAGAQQQRATPPTDSVAQAVASPRGFPVIVGTDTLFRLYGDLGPFSAETRARMASERLRQWAASSRVRA